MKKLTNLCKELDGNILSQQYIHWFQMASDAGHHRRWSSTSPGVTTPDRPHVPLQPAIVHRSASGGRRVHYTPSTADEPEVPTRGTFRRNAAGRMSPQPGVPRPQGRRSGQSLSSSDTHQRRRSLPVTSSTPFHDFPSPPPTNNGHVTRTPRGPMPPPAPMSPPAATSPYTIVGPLANRYHIPRSFTTGVEIPVTSYRGIVSPRRTIQGLPAPRQSPTHSRSHSSTPQLNRAVSDHKAPHQNSPHGEPDLSSPQPAHLRGSDSRRPSFSSNQTQGRASDIRQASSSVILKNEWTDSGHDQICTDATAGSGSRRSTRGLGASQPTATNPQPATIRPFKAVLDGLSERVGAFFNWLVAEDDAWDP